MSASPEYLELLDDVQIDSDIISISSYPDGMLEDLWQELDTKWTAFNILEGVSLFNVRTDLYWLAVTGFGILCELNGWTARVARQEMELLHAAKNAGYAGADHPDPWRNFRTSTKFQVPAWKGVLVRLGDKYSRTVSLRENPNNERTGEHLAETVIDFVAYALIGLCLIKELEGQSASLVQSMPN